MVGLARFIHQLVNVWLVCVCHQVVRADATAGLRERTHRARVVQHRVMDDEELRAIPVIAITAFAMKGEEEKIRQGGCEAYLSKPISVVKFLETVRNYIGDK